MYDMYLALLINKQKKLKLVLYRKTDDLAQQCKSINNGHWPQNLLERLKFVENKVYLLNCMYYIQVAKSAFYRHTD